MELDLSSNLQGAKLVEGLGDLPLKALFPTISIHFTPFSSRNATKTGVQQASAVCRGCAEACWSS